MAHTAAAQATSAIAGELRRLRVGITTAGFRLPAAVGALAMLVVGTFVATAGIRYMAATMGTITALWAGAAVYPALAKRCK